MLISLSIGNIWADGRMDLTSKYAYAVWEEYME